MWTMMGRWIYWPLVSIVTESQGSDSSLQYFGAARNRASLDSTVSVLSEVADFGIVVDIDVGDFDGDGINDVLLNRVGSPPGRGFYDGIVPSTAQGAWRIVARSPTSPHPASITEQLLKRLYEQTRKLV